MPTVEGTIESVNAGPRFIAVFDIGETTYTYSGIIESLPQPFTCESAKLTYTSEMKLAGKRTFAGSIGKSTLLFTLGDDVTIEGPLEEPTAAVRAVTGSGSWAWG